MWQDSFHRPSNQMNCPSSVAWDQCDFKPLCKLWEWHFLEKEEEECAGIVVNATIRFTLIIFVFIHVITKFNIVDTTNIYYLCLLMRISSQTSRIAVHWSKFYYSLYLQFFSITHSVKLSVFKLLFVRG